MWIRSQKKSILRKVNRLQILDNKIIDYISYNSENRVYDILGQYKSEERCIEILDEIQNFKNNIYCGIKNDPMSFIYEMPQE